MARRRVEMSRLLELVRLHRLGCSARETSRLLAIGPNTARRYRDILASAGLLAGRPEDPPPTDRVRSAVDAAFPPPPHGPRSSSVEPWRQEVERLVEQGLTARAVFDRLLVAARPGAERPFRGSYQAVKRLCKRIVREHAGGDAVVVPVESSPGECAQVDFGYAGRLYDPSRGTLRRAWAFVMVLAFSRWMWVRLVFDQRVETWLRLHAQAFSDIGGVVAVVRPDNTRRAVLRAAFGVDDDCELHRNYRELARHYRFKIDPAPPGAPRKRGKAEAAVRYLRSNPLKSRNGENFDLVQADLLRWNAEIASVRIHGTTKRRPLELFNEVERAALQPLPTAACELAPWKRARVHADCHVAFGERLFSAPWQLVGQVVWIRARGPSVEVFHGEELVALHPRRGPRRSTVDAHLPPDRQDYRHRARTFWEERASRIGPATTYFVRAVFDQDDVLLRLRSAQAIVKHLERHPRGRAEAVSSRALERREFSYRAIRTALAAGLDLIGE